jgi:hypothetical protein
VPAFEGQRRPFEPGHQLTVKHGAYAGVLALSPRVEQIATVLLERMSSELAIVSAFGPVVEGVAIAGSRLERSLALLETATDAAAVEALDRAARGWVRTYLAGLATLGLTPPAAIRMGLNLALTDAAQRRLSLQELAAMQAEAQAREEVRRGS